MATSTLRGSDYTRLEFATRSSRPIGSESHRTSRPEGPYGPEEGPGSTSGAGAPDCTVSQCQSQVRQILPVAGLTHHDCYALCAVLPQQRQEGLMPEQEDVGPTCLVERAPPLLVRDRDSPGRRQHANGGSGEIPDDSRRYLQSDAPRSSTASATTRVVAPASPSRSRTRAKPSRWATVRGSDGSRRGLNASARSPADA